MEAGAPSEKSDSELISEVLGGNPASFEPIVLRYQPRLFAMARRYSRREDEVQDLVQEILLKAFQKLASYRAEAPFEHWLMRLAIRTCYDFLRAHRRNRESMIADLAEDEQDWLDRFAASPAGADVDGDAARALVAKLLDRLSPPARLVITLLEIEDRSVKEVAELTGWSVPVVKIRAFRARAEMRRHLKRLGHEKYL